MTKEKLEELVKVGGKEMTTRLSPTNLESTQLCYANEDTFEVLVTNTLEDTD